MYQPNTDVFCESICTFHNYEVSYSDVIFNPCLTKYIIQGSVHTTDSKTACCLIIAKHNVDSTQNWDVKCIGQYIPSDNRRVFVENDSFILK